MASDYGRLALIPSLMASDYGRFVLIPSTFAPGGKGIFRIVILTSENTVTTNFGPLAPHAPPERTAAAAAFYVPRVECYPACPGPSVKRLTTSADSANSAGSAGTSTSNATSLGGGSPSAGSANFTGWNGTTYTGLLPAFVYQTAEELGFPSPTVPAFGGGHR